MRYKNKCSCTSFDAKVKKDNIIIRCFNGNKKVGEDKVNIDDYLSNDMQFGRRLFIIDRDINSLKTDMLEFTPSVIDINADCIKKAIDGALKDAGLYKLTLSGKMEEFMKNKRL